MFCRASARDVVFCYEHLVRIYFSLTPLSFFCASLVSIHAAFDAQREACYDLGICQVFDEVGEDLPARSRLLYIEILLGYVRNQETCKLSGLSFYNTIIMTFSRSNMKTSPCISVRPRKSAMGLLVTLFYKKPISFIA